VHCRIVRRRMGNRKEDQAPDRTSGISSNKYAFYPHTCRQLLIFFPFKKPFFQGELPEQFREKRVQSMGTALFLYIPCIHFTLVVYEGEIWQLKSYP
jgi:hypothetical protein